MSIPRRYAAVVTKALSHLRFITDVYHVTTQLMAYRAVMNVKVSSGLSLAHPYPNTRVNLVSLGLGQLSASHALLHFGR